MKLKKILALVLCFTMVLSSMGFSVFAESDVTVVTTTLKLKEALAQGGTVKLGNNIQVMPTDEGVEDNAFLYLETGEGSVLDLNGYVLENYYPDNGEGDITYILLAKT